MTSRLAMLVARQSDEHAREREADAGFVGMATALARLRYTLSEFHVDFAIVNVARVLRAALALPDRLADAQDEVGIHAVACRNLVEALSRLVRRRFETLESVLFLTRGETELSFTLTWMPRPQRSALRC